ncbi:MAG: type II secretion system F family protein [Planctomycetota bacterium]|jgi:type IV pilus assembly protein PilC
MSTLAVLVSDSPGVPWPVVIILILVLMLGVAVLLDVILGSWLKQPRWWLLRNREITRAIHLRQTSTTRSLVGHLSTITNLNLPLPEALQTAGSSERGLLGQALGQMAVHTAAGRPLANALRSAHPGCSPLVVSVIAAGERCGQLPRALADVQQALTDQLHKATTGRRESGRYWLYPCVLALITLCIVMGIMITVVPKFEEIFQDFDVQLPGVTLALIDIANWFVAGAPPGWLLLVLVPLVCMVAVAGLALALRDPKTTMSQTITDGCRWIPGLTRPIAFGQGMSAAIRVVDMGLAAGMTLQRAAGLAATLDLNRSLRRRWLHFVKLIDTGTPTPEAVEQAGLGNVFAWACRTIARGNADVAVVLRHAADYHRAIADRWWRALTGMVWPPVICLLGCMVGFVVLALYMPLVALINSVMGTV